MHIFIDQKGRKSQAELLQDVEERRVEEGGCGSVGQLQPGAARREEHGQEGGSRHGEEDGGRVRGEEERGGTEAKEGREIARLMISMFSSGHIQHALFRFSFKAEKAARFRELEERRKEAAIAKKKRNSLMTRKTRKGQPLMGAREGTVERTVSSLKAYNQLLGYFMYDDTFQLLKFELMNETLTVELSPGWR